MVPLCSTRFMVSVLVMFAAFLLYCHKIDLSVNIVCMVNHSGLQLLRSNVTAIGVEDNHHNQSQLNSATKSDGPFLWSKPAQGFLLTGFFWGYTLAQIPAALIGSLYGPKYTILTAILISGICASCYKIAAFKSIYILWALRVIVGTCTGAVLPCASQLWTAWAPNQDRSFLIGFAMSGCHLGCVATLPLGGILCVKGWDGGWPSLFYLIGAACGVWVLLWIFLFTNTPETHRCISEEERKFIAMNTMSHKKLRFKDIPWKRILTNKAFIANAACQTMMHWGLYTLLTSIPNYFKDVLHFDIKANGAVSAIPYAFMWLFTSSSGMVADFFIGRELLSRTTTRKISNLLGSIPVGCCLIGLGYLKKDQPVLAVILLAASQGLFGIAFGSGYMVVANDIAGGYAGLAFGIANSVGSIPGIISPYVTAFVTRNKLQSEWRVVFMISAIIYMLAGLTFMLFGSAEPQGFEKPLQESVLREMEPMNPVDNRKMP